MDGTKQAFRQEIRERRRALPPDVVWAAGRAIARLVARWVLYRHAPAVLLYVATDGEIPTKPLIEQALGDGKRVLLPRVAGSSLAFADYLPGQSLRRGRFGIPEPAGAAADLGSLSAAVAFVPLVAWDRAGERLGRGGGFYDRALASLAPGSSRVGLGYDFQQRPALPADPWDVRLDWVVTESGIVRCSGVSGALDGKEITSSNGMDMGHRRGGTAGAAARTPGRAGTPRSSRGRGAIGAGYGRARGSGGAH